MLKGFQEAAKELDREIDNYKKDRSTRKTSAYKEKKLAKATALIEKAEALVKKINSSLTTPEQCFELEVKTLDQVTKPIWQH